MIPFRFVIDLYLHAVGMFRLFDIQRMTFRNDSYWTSNGRLKIVLIKDMINGITHHFRYDYMTIFSEWPRKKGYVCPLLYPLDLLYPFLCPLFANDNMTVLPKWRWKYNLPVQRRRRRLKLLRRWNFYLVENFQKILRKVLAKSQCMYYISSALKIE